MRQNADILIRNITVYTQDEQRRVLPETDVAIREGKIAQSASFLRRNGRLPRCWMAPAKPFSPVCKTYTCIFSNLC